ncbi:MAG: ceramidase domain-containing protein [Candidatus Entotheonellia bacterium]
MIIVVGSLALMLSQQPFGQDPKYHDFADRRVLLGIPNFFDVISNLPFLLVGIAGVRFCLRNGFGALRPAWIALFTGVALVGIGSAYYHWDPHNETLVWDRMSMTIGFMGLFVALWGEYVSENIGKVLLVPAVLLGFCSVLYWHWFDDLRFYYWIQLIPLLIVPVVMVLFRSRYSHQWLLLVALACYIFAKVSEAHDREMFIFTRGLFSGHALKHLLAALGCFTILGMLKTRKLLHGDSSASHAHAEGPPQAGYAHPLGP